MTIEEAERKAEPVDGFISVDEGRLLYSLAERSPGPVVEVGSWKGKSTIWLAIGARSGPGRKVFAVDPHEGSQDHREKNEESTLGEFWRNMAQAGIGNVIPLVMTSEGARDLVPCPVGMVFLDGPTEGEEIIGEIDRWLECIGPGGIIALHDTVSMRGPQRAAEHLYLSSRFADTRLQGTITYATVVPEAGIAAKMTDLFRLLVRRAEVILGRVPYPAPIGKLGRRLLDTLTR